MKRIKNRAYTLFEVMFSLALILVLMAVIGTAIESHLHNQFHNRMQVEEGQFARALLNRIAADLRGVVLDLEEDENATATSTEETEETETEDDTASDSYSTESDEEDASYDDYYDYENEIIGTKKGIYGGIDWIQIDTLRTVPGERFAYGSSDYSYSYDEDEEYIPELDLLDCGQKTVLYYLGYDSGTTDADAEYLERLEKTNVAPRRRYDRSGLLTSNIKYGLYYREMNRTIVDYAVESGLDSVTNMGDYDEHLAPEVDRIEFYYYISDGTEASFEDYEPYEEWDMDIEGELPLAIEIRLYIRRKGYKPTLSGLLSNEDERERTVVYSLFVPMSRELIDLSETEETTDTDTSEAI